MVIVYFHDDGYEVIHSYRSSVGLNILGPLDMGDILGAHPKGQGGGITPFGKGRIRGQTNGGGPNNKCHPTRQEGLREEHNN